MLKNSVQEIQDSTFMLNNALFEMWEKKFDRKQNLVSCALSSASITFLHQPSLFCFNLTKNVNFYLRIIWIILITCIMSHKSLGLLFELCISTLCFSEWVSESKASCPDLLKTVCYQIFCIFWIHVWWIHHNNGRAQQSRQSYSLTFR